MRRLKVLVSVHGKNHVVLSGLSRPSAHRFYCAGSVRPPGCHVGAFVVRDSRKEKPFEMKYGELVKKFWDILCMVEPWRFLIYWQGRQNI